MKVQFLHLSRVRISALFLFIAFFLYQHPIFAHDNALKYNAVKQEITLLEAIHHISEQYQVLFNYDRKIVSNIRVKYEPESFRNVDEAISSVLSKTDLKYQIFNHRYVVIYKNDQEGIESLKEMIQHFQTIVDKRDGVVSERRRMNPAPVLIKTLPQFLLSNKEIMLSIEGTVTDQEGVALIGVNIQVKGTNQGTATDLEGRFVLEDIDENALLVVSYIGYLTQEVAVAGKSSLAITLLSDSQLLDEVVVVGYGTQKRKDLTGSVSILGETQLKNKFFTNGTETLRGVKGVYVSQPGAQPGKGVVSIRIRGQGTLNNNNPLILVDGIEYDLANIDPNNIKSISVLKDASAAAIYGARAANGVILVTTKTGENTEGFNISYNNYFGVSRAINLPDYINDPIEFFELRNLAQRNAGKSTVTYSDELIEEYRNGMLTNPIVYPQTNWYEIALQNAFVQNHNIRLAGGNDNFDYSLSVGFNGQNGILKGTGSDKYSFDLNTTLKATDKIDISAIIGGQLNKFFEPPAGAVYLMDQVNREASVPYDVLFTEDGEYADNFVRTPGHNAYRHPLAIINEGSNINNDQALRFSLKVDYSISDDLKYSMLGGYTKQDYLQHIFEPEIYQYNVKTNEPVRSRIAGTPIRHAHFRDSYNYQTNFQHTLNWDENINHHSFYILLGNSIQIIKNNNFFARREGYLGNDLTSLNAGSTNPDVGGTFNKSTLASVFGRLRYSFKSKYLFEANFREDGSSLFAEGNRWGLFPSFSAGWQIGNEKFLQDINWMDALKIRASWGKLGNNRIPAFRYVNLVDLGHDYSFGDNIISGGAITSYNDPKITWETTTTSNIGIDGSFFENSLDLSIEYYYKKTTDILHEVNIPAQVGALNGPIQNIGSVANKGIEVSVNYRNSIGNFKYDIMGDISTVQNKVLSLNNQTIYNYGWRNNGGTIITEGHPIDAFFLIHNTGIFQNKEEIEGHAFQSNDTKPGYLKFEDVNNDGKINTDDRIISNKSRIPKFTYSFNFKLGYKRLNLSAWLTGVGKVYSFSNYYGIVPFWYGSGITEYWVENSWTPDNPDAKLPILTTYEDATNTNFRDSDFLLYNVSYLRLKNLQLSYNLPSDFTDLINIEFARIFISSDNLLTFTPMPYYDPEKNLSNQTFNGYPASMTFTGGISINF